MSKKPITTKEISSATLAPIIAHAAANRGFTDALAQAMTKRLRRPVLRQQVYQWLRWDYEQRSEPLHGAAAVLIEEAARIMAKGKL